jgi:hypothetical protein
MTESMKEAPSRTGSDPCAMWRGMTIEPAGKDADTVSFLGESPFTLALPGTLPAPLAMNSAAR